MGKNYQFAKRDWYYNFRQFSGYFDETSIAKFSQSNLALYSDITKNWDDNLNSEWICRVYLSAKLVMLATLMLNSLEFAESKNIRVTSSYLKYFSIQSSLRAIVFMSPIAKWREGGLITLPHKKTINVACDAIAKLDKDFSKKIKKYILHLKAFRELISYRAPSSGDAFKKIEFELDLIDLCTLLCEIAQAQSELLEVSVNKNAKGNYDFIDHYMDHVCHTQIHGYAFWDDEDWYRIGYLKRKYPRPTNILHVMAEGHVEDFFYGWWPTAEDDHDNIEDRDIFNPDHDWGVIFDLP